MLRKGRFDELFFVDLPNQAERQAIWKIQITKLGREPKLFDMVQLARATEGLTGSESAMSVSILLRTRMPLRVLYFKPRSHAPLADSDAGSIEINSPCASGILAVAVR